MKLRLAFLVERQLASQIALTFTDACTFLRFPMLKATLSLFLIKSFKTDTGTKISSLEPTIIIF